MAGFDTFATSYIARISGDSSERMAQPLRPADAAGPCSYDDAETSVESSSPGDPDEHLLMSRVRDGDVKAFESIVERFWRGTVLYIKQLVPDADVADDVAQEAFSRLWQMRAEWVDTGSVRVWLLRTSRNLVINESRRSAVRAEWAAEAQAKREGRPRTPLQEAEAAELRQAILRAVEELSPRRREAFNLVHLQGLSYQEGADIMGVRTQTVANYLQAALCDLRDLLRPHFRGFDDADDDVLDIRSRDG